MVEFISRHIVADSNTFFFIRLSGPFQGIVRHAFFSKRCVFASLVHQRQ